MPPVGFQPEIPVCERPADPRRRPIGHRQKITLDLRDKDSITSFLVTDLQWIYKMKSTIFELTIHSVVCLTPKHLVEKMKGHEIDDNLPLMQKALAEITDTEKSLM